MTNFVIVTKNKSNVPSGVELEAAMLQSYGSPRSVEPAPDGKKLTYEGDVNHNTYQNNLMKVAGGKQTSWNFTWGDAVAATVVDASRYEVTIKMDAATVTDLTKGNYNLYGFKAVASPSGDGDPVVWFQVPAGNYSASTDISWEVQYQAYTSTTSISAGVTIVASFAADIELGQQLDVVAGGTGTVTDSQNPLSIGINNETEQEFTCGISQSSPTNSTPSPMCAFPLYGLTEDIITPIEKVVFLFSSEPINTGAVVEQSNSAAIVIDLTEDNSRSVSYDINRGWSWGEYAWAYQLAADANLVPVLIESPASSPTEAAPALAGAEG